MIWALLACGSGCETPLTLGGRTRCAQLAITDEERRTGLTGRAPLGSDEALVLQFPLTTEVCIQTESLSYPIDIVFVGEDDRVHRVACARPPTAPVLCVAEVRRVIEVRPDPACPTWVGSTVR